MSAVQGKQDCKIRKWTVNDRAKHNYEYIRVKTYANRKTPMKTNFLTNLEVFRYSFWETKTMFFNLP